MAEKEIKGIQKFFEEFKAFAMRGNVLDMAVGVVVGSAFTAIVNSLVGDIISPLIGLFFNADFSDVVIQIGDVGIGIGSFLNAIINFLIVAFVLFVVLKAFNALFNKKKAEEEAPAEPTTKVCPYCQSEISIKAGRFFGRCVDRAAPSSLPSQQGKRGRGLLFLGYSGLTARRSAQRAYDRSRCCRTRRGTSRRRRPWHRC